MNTFNSSQNLPFAENNIHGMTAVLNDSDINGNSYELTVADNNPTKAQIQSLLKNTFADADENDVSLVYIVAHGHKNVDGWGSYGFSIPGYANYLSDTDTYVTSYELMNWLSGIEGRVVLVLTTCYSGGFIDDNMSRLAAAGNISVVCSSHKTTNSSYFQHKEEKYNVDTFTYSLLYTLGFHEQEDTFHDMYADANGDNMVTVHEAFYASAAETLKTIKRIKGMSGFKNSALQTVQYYIADGMEDIPIIGRDD